MTDHPNTANLAPLAPNEPTRMLPASVVLVELARIEFGCEDPRERDVLIRAQARIRELAGIPPAHP